MLVLAQPDPVTEPRKRRQIAPVEAVAELANDGRTFGAEDGPRQSCNDRVGVARTKNHVRAMLSHPGDELPDHPQGLEAARQWMRWREIIKDIVGRDRSFGAIVAAHDH